MIAGAGEEQFAYYEVVGYHDAVCLQRNGGGGGDGAVVRCACHFGAGSVVERRVAAERNLVKARQHVNRHIGRIGYWQGCVGAVADVVDGEQRVG